MSSWMHYSYLFMPEIFVFLGASAVVLRAGFATSKSAALRDARTIACMTILAALLAFYNLWFADTESHHLFSKDMVATGASILVLLSLLFWTALTAFQMEFAGIYKAEYYALLLFAALGILVMTTASNLITVYIGVEIQSLAFYAMIAMRKNGMWAREAAIKYFVLGAVASAVLLYGCALVYGSTGALSFNAIGAQLVQDPVLHSSFMIGMVLVLVGFFFKLSAAPFHVWAPEVYQGSSFVQVGLLAIAPKIGVLVHMMRLTYGPFYAFKDMVEIFLMGVIVLSLLIGSLGGLYQTNIRRLIAYSGIAQMGFLLLAFLGGAQNLLNIGGYLLAYMIAILPLVWALSRMQQAGEEVVHLASLKGLAQRYPLTAFLIATCLLSLTGIPPLPGFFAKFYVLLGAVESGYSPLVIFALVMSIVAAFYYLRLIKYMYFDEPEADVFMQEDKTLTIFFLLLNVVFVIYQNTWTVYIEKAVFALPVGV